MEEELRILARFVWKYHKLWKMGILGIPCKGEIFSFQVSKKDLSTTVFSTKQVSEKIQAGDHIPHYQDK